MGQNEWEVRYTKAALKDTRRLKEPALGHVYAANDSDNLR